ncbi:MAG: hypothetical protein A2798_01900 [Candidatus Levybacteria bacterium RIFCSPHIGHO2_01_FULL_37_17]|nr:MAG: hypothetical protein A2798_01900 [Candidatus Levybacteria bacterium RIFCSPHIGHO2_01_FULL_37_17]
MFKKFLNWKLLLFSITILAAILRFYQLGSNPPSLTWDEVAWGYNAYSLSVDAKDEFGKFLPITYLESFGDFKPPAYAYLTVIPVMFFGLSEFAVRFPSALFGTLTVLLTYFLVIRIFPNSKNKELVAILSALFLAISPWHIMLSRAAFEANVANFFIVTGIWAFLGGVQGKKWLLLVSAVSFALSFYAFNTARIISPLLVILLAFVFRKRLFELKKTTLYSILLGLIIVVPLVPFLFTPQAQLRFKEVNIFTDSQVIETANKYIEQNGGAAWSNIMHNRRILFSLEYVKHYLDHFSPAFLFISGDENPKFSVQDVGQMYIWDILFLVTGIIFLFKRKEGLYYIIPLWLLVGIIPAATARETPHALRIETTLPTWQIITAYGFVVFLEWARKLNIKIRDYKLKAAYALPLIVFFFLFINVLYFLHNYYAHYPKTWSGEWQYGYKEAIDYVKSVEENYDKIVVTTALGRPYAYFLFYNKTNPELFRKTAVVERDPFGFVTVNSFGKYHFSGQFDQFEQDGDKNLYINIAAPDSADIKKTFYLLNGNPVLVAYEF